MPGAETTLHEYISDLAEGRGMEVVLGPDPGWVMTLPSGTKVLCGEHTDKAEPVWVWWAR